MNQTGKSKGAVRLLNNMSVNDRPNKRSCCAMDETRAPACENDEDSVANDQTCLVGYTANVRLTYGDQEFAFRLWSLRLAPKCELRKRLNRISFFVRYRRFAYFDVMLVHPSIQT
jgi:hypothetical protein